eukprot:scaffold24425_cov66-Phaeocystis_antarctica.AAC.4
MQATYPDPSPRDPPRAKTQRTRLATVACLEVGETHSFTKEDSLYTLLTCYPSSARLGSFSFRHVDTLTHLRAGYQTPLEPGPSFTRAPRPCFCGVSGCASLDSLARGASRGRDGQRRRREGGSAVEAERVRAEAGDERRVNGDRREADKRRWRGQFERAKGWHGRMVERLESVVVVRLDGRGEQCSERERGAELGVSREEDVGRPLVGRRCEHRGAASLVRREDGAARNDWVDDAARVRGDRRDGDAVGEDRTNGGGARGREAAV